jgi:hypothetical protein
MEQFKFITTKDPEDIQLILLDEVEGVLWQYGQSEEVKEAIASFDENQWDMSEDTLDAQELQFMDGNRLYVPSVGKNSPKELAPLWKERRALKKTFKDTLRSDHMPLAPLSVQKARRNEPDSVFHVDVCTGMDSKADQLLNDFIYASTAHKGLGSQAIPRADAGRPTPKTSENRACYYHPKTLENMITPKPGELLVFKAGTNGTVHRSPGTGRGLRWWSFYQLEGTIHTVRRNFSRKEKNDLRKRLQKLQNFQP